MGFAEILPYATSLGLAFILFGFVLLIWREGASHHFSLIAFSCFVAGIAISGYSLYAQQNEPPTPVSEIQASAESHTAEHIRQCLYALKQSFGDEVQKLGMKCRTDSLGWPDQKCVEKTAEGRALYEKLHTESEFCYRPPKK